VAANKDRSLVRFPATVRSPWWELSRRLVLAIVILVGTVLLVYLDRDGYRDNNDPHLRVGFIDSIYYTTVTLSTTGYGDIAPFTPGARLVNAFLITPLRIAFLVLLIGTTLEVLASQGREQFRVARWRKKMDDHVVDPAEQRGRQGEGGRRRPRQHRARGCQRGRAARGRR
jgi:voltage-gated potassium channel